MFLGLLVSVVGMISSHQLYSEPAKAKSGTRTDPFGDPLPAGAIARLGTLRFRQISYIHAFSPNGKIIATSYGSEIRLVDSETGKDIRLGRRHESGVRCLAWSKDGKFIASGTWGIDQEAAASLERLERRRAHYSRVGMFFS